MAEVLDFPEAATAAVPAPSKPWLTLAAIVGNEAHHIERFLQAFEPLVDEIVLVRAVGAQEPDQTLEIAQRVATKPLRVGEYKNHVTTADWPHVDDFGRARQAAFDLAEGEFVMWADCDDIIDPEAAKKLRAQVDLANFDVLLFQYRCKGAHPMMRERVIRKGCGRWVHAVHEAISIPPNVRAIIREDIEIFHYPVGGPDGSPKEKKSLERNLRILEHSVGSVALTYFYLHRDSLLKQDMKAALDWGKLAVATKELTVAERYKVYYNLAILFLGKGDFASMEPFAMNGIRLCPTRRECYCVMAMSEMERKDYVRALNWIEIAKCLTAPVPAARPNWFDDSWYGWRANLTQAVILRKLGRGPAALAAEDEENGGHPMISLLHATRGRPEKAIEARERWIASSLKPGMIEHIFAIDADDEWSLKAMDGFNVVVVAPGGGCVRAWNAAAEKARGRVLVQMSDDWNPAYHWDNLIAWRLKDAIEKKQPAVLAISDGVRKDKLMCMAILTREYYLSQREGARPYLFHPDYLGVYSDNEFTVRAYENGAVIEAKDIEFKHLHPVFGTAEMDATYQVQNSPERYAQGLAVFNRRNPRHKIEA